MCAWIACISGLSSIVLGARHAELGISFGQYTIEKLVAMTERKIRIVTGVLSVECASMCRTSPNFHEGPR
jgi:tRNA(Arg) A34 adenosine deaminase TadA